MLSKIKLEFLESPQHFDADYPSVLRRRVNSKIRGLREEIALLEKSGISITENCNAVNAP